MASTEMPYGLSPESLDQDLEMRSSVVVDNFHLVGVYGWHENVGDATDTLEAIDDSSIVFSEGYLKGLDYANLRLSQFAEIAEARLSTGSYDGVEETYEAFANEFVARQHSSNPPSYFSLILFKGLFEKNCLVLPADYMNLNGDADFTNRSVFDERVGLARSKLSYETLDEVVQVDIEASIAERKAAILREGYAVKTVLFFLNHYHQNGQLDTIARTTEEKALTYFIYGAAHRNSLTTRFENLGIPIERIFLGLKPQIDELLDLSFICSFSEDEIRSEEFRARVRDYYLGKLSISESSEVHRYTK